MASIMCTLPLRLRIMVDCFHLSEHLRNGRGINVAGQPVHAVSNEKKSYSWYFSEQYSLSRSVIESTKAEPKQPSSLRVPIIPKSGYMVGKWNLMDRTSVFPEKTLSPTPPPSQIPARFWVLIWTGSLAKIESLGSDVRPRAPSRLEGNPIPQCLASSAMDPDSS